jgi:hypothetical protein
MTISVIRGVLSAAIATTGTFAVGYPNGTSRGTFLQGINHRLSALGRVFVCPDDITISFGSTSATVTYNGATTLPQGTPFSLQLDEIGTINPVLEPATGLPICGPVTLAHLNLGSPGTASSNGILLSAAVTAAVLATTVLTGGLVVGGVAVMDARTGRNVVAAWTGTSVLTVRGFDMYGKALTESSASGTSFTGKKAFKTVTSIQFSADVTGCTVGSGVILGLPVAVPNVNAILKENLDGAAATAGTLAAGLAVVTKSTATTADIRGTYSPNSAPDGSRAFLLLAALADPSFLGGAQFAG